MSSEPLLPTTSTNVVEKSIKILFTNETIQPISLNITSVSKDVITITWLRRMIRDLNPGDTTMRTLRFLRSGNMVTKTTFHSQISTYINSKSVDIAPFFIHCIISIDTKDSEEQIVEEEQKDDNGLRTVNSSQAEDGQSMGAIGFDRLRSVGFSDEEIELLRSQFRATYGDLENYGGEEADEENETNESNNDEETPAPNANIRELEEQWMENNANDDDDRFNSVPIANFKHNMDLLIGISVGFLFGIFSLILMKFDGLFNKRQKMSIFAGVMVNIIFSLLRSFD